MELYKTQQDLMAKMATEKGIQISEITTHFQQELSQVYEGNPHCAESSALGRAEYAVWKQFFPDDPWPGTSPITTPNNAPSTTLATMQSPLKAETMGSESGEIIESPDKKDGQSSLPDKPKPTLSLKIEDILLTAAGNPKILMSYKEALENVKRRYPRENLEWQIWMSGNKVWTTNFSQKGSFPFNEPPRSYVLFSSTDQPSTRYPRHGEDKSRHGWRSGGNWQAQDGASQRRSRSPPTGPRRGYGAIRPYDSAIKGRTIQSEQSLERSHSCTYAPKESFMENKALARGGNFLRHVFFRTLQKSRDEVRANYSDVDRLFKHWLADKLTWERIFKKEPFPWLSEKPPAFPLSDENPSGKNTGNTSMAHPPPQTVTKKFKVTTLAGDDLLTNSHRDQSRSRYNVRGNNFNQSKASSNGRNPFDQTRKLDGAVLPFGSSPEMPRFRAALPNKGVIGHTSRMFVTSDSARLKAHTRTTSNTSNMQSEKNPVKGTRDVIIRRNTIFRALLGEWDGSFKSVQRALGVTIEYIDDASGHLKLTIESYQPGDNEALDRAYNFLETWKKLIYSDHLIKLDHFWTQFKTHDTMTTIDYQAVVHVNGKNIRCPGKFGDLCEFFSREIQTYQSTMAEFDGTEKALACSTIFEARPYSIYLESYPFPIMLRADTKTRNKVLDQHNVFLEEWVRSIEDIRSATSLADMSNAYGRRRGQRLMGMEMDLSLDELLKEGAAKANQKRISQAAECDEDSVRADKRRCL